MVHLGVVLLAVGIIAATSYRHQAELALHRGVPVTYDGHRFEFEGLRTVHTPSRSAQQAVVRVDGALFAPAVTSFGGNLAVVGTPAIDSGVFGDVYLTFDAVGGLGASSGNLAINNLPSGSVAVGVVIEPLVAWLWAGGLLVGLGGFLALVPGVETPRHRSRLGHAGPRHEFREAPTGSRPRRDAGGRARARPRPRPRARGRPVGSPGAPGMIRRRHAIRWVAGAVLATLAVVGVVLATRTPQEATAVQSPLQGRVAPEISGANLLGGTRVSLSSLRGHYVVVNFFASWCTPCQQEAPDLSRFAYEQAHKRGGADLVSVVFHDSSSSAHAFLVSNGDLWPVVADPGGAIAARYGVTNPPTTFVIDPAGRVTAVLLGPTTGQNLESYLHPKGSGTPPSDG